MDLTDSPSDAIGSVAFISLGCAKNLVDSEKMLGLLAEAGLAVAADEDDADAIVINTCGFLEAAKAESLDVIRQAARHKQTGRCRRLVVVGCLVQRHRAKLLQWCPQIDALLGVFDRDRIVQAVRGSRQAHDRIEGFDEGTAAAPALPVYSSIAANDTLAQRQRGLDVAGYHESDTARLRLTPRHYAYLRIAEGCDQHCSFCTIPAIRGKLRSKPLDRLLDEAAELLADGAFELNLIGQDTTSYGRDLDDAPGLAGMLRELDGLAGQFGGAWLRLMYAYPACLTDEMIDTFASLDHLLAYLDIPLQHISDDMLTAMRRNTTRRQIESLLAQLRRRVPGIAIRTTFISGFPGETDDHHRQLVEFIGDFQFDHLGVFAFSPEPGTPAGSLHAAGLAVPDAVIDQRIEELMLRQQQVVFTRNERWAQQQQSFDVLIDGRDESDDADAAQSPVDRSETTDRRYLGRATCQAPEIDPVTFVRSSQELSPGQVIRCTVIGSRDYDLIARPSAELSNDIALPLA